MSVEWQSGPSLLRTLSHSRPLQLVCTCHTTSVKGVVPTLWNPFVPIGVRTCSGRYPPPGEGLTRQCYGRTLADLQVVHETAGTSDTVSSAAVLLEPERRAHSQRAGV